MKAGRRHMSIWEKKGPSGSEKLEFLAQRERQQMKVERKNVRE